VELIKEQAKGRGAAADATAEGVAEELVPGRVLSAAGGLVRTALSGPVAVGQVVDIDGTPGAVLRFDRRCAMVALLAPDAALPVAGAPVVPKDRVLTVRGGFGAAGRGVEFTSVVELLLGDEKPAAAWPPVLRLPAPLQPAGHFPQRGRRLPSGLAAVEALVPLAEGRRVGLVGPSMTGKSTAARMLLGSQSAGTARVYAAQKPLQTLQQHFASNTAAATATTVVVYADPLHDSTAAQYLIPLCALQVAQQVRGSHRHVLLVLDDLTLFAEAAADLGTPPLSAPQVLAAALDCAGVVQTVGGGGEDEEGGALSVVCVLDLAPEEDLPLVPRELFDESAIFTGTSREFGDAMVCPELLTHVGSEIERDANILKQVRKAREERRALQP